MVNLVALVFLLTANRKHAGLYLLPGEEYADISTSDRSGGYDERTAEKRQLCWTHLSRNLVALAE